MDRHNLKTLFTLVLLLISPHKSTSFRCPEGIGSIDRVKAGLSLAKELSENNVKEGEVFPVHTLKNIQDSVNGVSLESTILAGASEWPKLDIVSEFQGKIVTKAHIQLLLKMVAGAALVLYGSYFLCELQAVRDALRHMTTELRHLSDAKQNLDGDITKVEDKLEDIRTRLKDFQEGKVYLSDVTDLEREFSAVLKAVDGANAALVKLCRTFDDQMSIGEYLKDKAKDDLGQTVVGGILVTAFSFALAGPVLAVPAGIVAGVMALFFYSTEGEAITSVEKFKYLKTEMAGQRKKLGELKREMSRIDTDITLWRRRVLH